MIALKSFTPGTNAWLRQAVVISLFTDARLTDGDPAPDSTTERGGHWGDIFTDGNDSVGSTLWTLRRQKLTPATINRARDIAYTALLWLLSTPYVSAINVATEKYNNQTLGFLITLKKPDGTQHTIKETLND